VPPHVAGDLCINQLLSHRNDDSRLVPYDEKYTFGFIEHKQVVPKHPISGCFLVVEDLSISASITVK